MGYIPGYMRSIGSYGPRWGVGGVAMKREEDEMRVSFSVPEEEEEEEAEAEKEGARGAGGVKRGWSRERWDLGMEMD